ncbi:hypothetical protein Droror1_Dr00014772 [Drosera rotundifolia]
MVTGTNMVIGRVIGIDIGHRSMHWHLHQKLKGMETGRHMDHRVTDTIGSHMELDAAYRVFLDHGITITIIGVIDMSHPLEQCPRKLTNHPKILETCRRILPGAMDGHSRHLGAAELHFPNLFML